MKKGKAPKKSAKKNTMVATPGRRFDPEKYDGKTPLPLSEQEFFCELYTSNKLPAFWGNATSSYMFAYGHTQRIENLKDRIQGTAKDRAGKTKVALQREIQQIYKVCNSAGPKLMVNLGIKKRIGQLMDDLADHLIVDRELLFTIQQRDNLDVKMRAIEHHDKRAGRIRDKVDITHNFEPIDAINYLLPAKK